MEILGYIGALLIGLILGLIGSGGSVLAVPIFIYLFLFDEKIATAYSLFVVGSTSLVGSLSYRKKKIDKLESSLAIWSTISNICSSC